MELNTDLFKIEHNNIAPEKGGILISEPFTEDSVFKRSVVLLTDHNETGSIGFIINKPIKKKIYDISSEFGNFDAVVCIGGPVSRDRIYILHTLGKLIPNSVKIKDNLYWGGDTQVLSEKIAAGIVKTNQVRFFVGYAGWEPNQLEDEINKNYWLVSTIDVKTVMKPFTKIWNNVVSNLDDKYKIWGNFPENPLHN